MSARNRFARTSALALVAILLAGSVPVSALAQDENNGGKDAEKITDIKVSKDTDAARARLNATIYKSWEETVPASEDGAVQASPQAPAGTTVFGASTTNSAYPQSVISTTVTNAFPDKQWWTKFNDPQLNAYIAESVKNNPGLEASMQRIQQARAAVAESISRQLPSLSLNPSFYRIGLPDSLTSSTGGLIPSAIKLFMLAFQASYELDIFGKNWNQTSAVRREAEAVALDSRSYLVSLEGEVASAYFNLLRADALVASQSENLDLLTRINSLKRDQHSAGLTTYDEVIRSERDVAQAITNLTNYKQQQALYAHQLSVLLGRTPQSADTLPRGTLANVTLPAETEGGIPSQLVTRRPDVLASERRLQRAAIDLRVARKQFLPTINLGGTVSMAGTEFKDAFDTDSAVNMQNVSISQPIFQGGRLVAGVKRQSARQREQIENYRQTVLTAFREVEDQLALLRSNYENLNSNATRLGLTEQSLRITQNQYEQGIIPRLNVLQAQTELVQYRQLNSQGKADAAVATVNLYKALGGGF